MSSAEPPPPPGPVLVTVGGTWGACGPAWCLDGTPLDLGPASAYADRASADLDGDSTVETNPDEFAGLAGKPVSLRVQRHAGTLQVFLVNGHDYRNADGSLARMVAAP